MEDKPKKKNLNIEVPTIIHDQVKERGIEHNCSMTRWILRAIINQLKLEEQYK